MVKFALADRTKKVDLEKVITPIGLYYCCHAVRHPQVTRENFTVEFVAHRKGGRMMRLYQSGNGTSQHHLPFVDLLLGFRSQQILRTSR